MLITPRVTKALMMRTPRVTKILRLWRLRFPMIPDPAAKTKKRTIIVCPVLDHMSHGTISSSQFPLPRSVVFCKPWDLSRFSSPFLICVLMHLISLCEQDDGRISDALDALTQDGAPFTTGQNYIQKTGDQCQMTERRCSLHNKFGCPFMAQVIKNPSKGP